MYLEGSRKIPVFSSYCTITCVLWKVLKAVQRSAIFLQLILELLFLQVCRMKQLSRHVVVHRKQ
jgi:hypothetical protein